MARRTITIESFTLPSGAVDARVTLKFTLVSNTKPYKPVDGYRSEDNEGVVGVHIIKMYDAPATVDLTPNSEISPGTLWQTEVVYRGLVISKYRIALASGPDLSFPEFLALDENGDSWNILEERLLTPAEREGLNNVSTPIDASNPPATMADVGLAGPHTHTLSDITDAGTAAASDVGDFATAAQGALAGSALQEVANDQNPTLGGDLIVGGATSYDIHLTNTSNDLVGLLGTVLPDNDVALARVDSLGDYDPLDGGLLLQSGGMELHGANIELPALSHSDQSGYEELRVSQDGVIFAAAPADPGWHETDASAANVAIGATWTRVTDLEILLPEDVAEGELINVTAKIYIVNSTGNKGDAIAVGVGIDNAPPVQSGSSQPIVEDFEGYVTFGMSSSSHGGGTTGQLLSVWLMNVTDNANISADGSANAHSVDVTVLGGVGQDAAMPQVVLTQAEYDALTPPDPSTIYNIIEEGCTP